MYDACSGEEPFCRCEDCWVRIRDLAWNRSINRWARWFTIFDRLPRPIRRIIPRRFL